MPGSVWLLPGFARAAVTHPPAPHPPGASLRLLCGLILGVSLLLFLSYLVYVLSGRQQFNDFFVFWAAARLSEHAPLAAAYDPQQFQAFKLAYTDGRLAQYPFLYPPSAMLLFRPFGLLPFGYSLLAWNLASLTLFLGAVRQALKPPLALFAALVAPATMIALLFGQTGLLTGAAALLGFSLLPRRPLLAGIVLGLLTLKPQLALLPLPLLFAAGHWRAGLAAVATAAALAGASLALYGAESWQAWLAALHGFSGGLSGSSAHRQFGITVYFALVALGLDSRAALALQALLALAVLWATARALRRGGEPARIAPLPALYLATPYAAAYDLPALGAACLLLFAAGQREQFRDGELLALGAAWFLPFLLMFSPVPLYALACGVLLALFLLVLRRMKPASAEAA
jgi:alpha-1,2-mannosyltransferase